MTDSDNKDLEAFQSSPEGTIYHAIYWLENAVDELCQADRILVREHKDKLASVLLSLGTLVNALTVKLKEAVVE